MSFIFFGARLPVFGELPRMEELPPDERLQASRDGDTPCNPPVFTDKESWQRRAAALREQVLMRAGLWPIPRKTPLRARVFGLTEHEGYTVEKVYFESFPGFYVTGNLYRPAGSASVQRAAILNPHGHWSRGRLHHDQLGSIPARCITFARLGYVAFSYDMVGYVDSWQVEHRYIDWSNSLWGIGIMGLQLWNSIRAIDFLSDLPGVDAGRLGCTGASGGGTQTFLLTAVDDRIQVSAPVNMISAHFQGGCVCENAPGLRIGTQSVELAATMAPRPMLMVSATGDWTKNTPQVEFPAIRRIYQLFDAENRLAWAQVDAGHNYNKASRAMVYKWFLRWLPPLEGDSPDDATAAETDWEGTVEPPPEEQLRIFASSGEKGPQHPVEALSQEGVFAFLRERAKSRLQENAPTTLENLERLRATYAPLWRQLLPAVPADSIKAVSRSKQALPSELAPVPTQAELLWLGRQAGHAVPALRLVPAQSSGGLVVLVHPEGKAALWQGFLAEHVQKQLALGHQVLGIDLFLTGEYQSPAGLTGRPHYPRNYTAFHYSDAALRAEDVATAIRWAVAVPGVTEVLIIGLGTAGAVCLTGAALLAAAAHPALKAAHLRLGVELGSFGDSDGDFTRHLFIPGLRQAGDVRVAVALLAPLPLVVGASHLPAHWRSWMQNAYSTLGHPACFSLVDEEALLPAVLGEHRSC